MEAEFMVELRARDFTVETVGVLEAENISSKHVFTCLQSLHIYSWPVKLASAMVDSDNIKTLN